jgi:hypothetical protein
MELDLAIHWTKFQFFFGENIETIGFINLENHLKNAIEGTSKK